MKRFLLLLSLLTLVLSSMAQVRVSGQVLDKKAKEGIPLAAISLQSTVDTTRIMNTVADLKGHYTLDSVPRGPYTLRVQVLGYAPLAENIAVEQSQGNVLRDIVLEETSYAMEGVRVEGVYKGQTVDKSTVTFSKQELQTANNSVELLNNLALIQKNPLGDNYVSIRGGSVQILLNGQKASYNDVRAIPKEKIKRVECYDIPPARYQDVDVVVNIITSPLDDGYVAGGSYTQALTTGFGDGNLYFSWVRGNHKLSVDYTLSYRAYSKVEDREKNLYSLNGVNTTEEIKKLGGFGYQNHWPTLKYAYIDNESSVYSVEFRPAWYRDYAYSKGEGFFQVDKQTREDLTTEGKDHEQDFSPSLDLYLWKQLSDNDEISVNLVNTFYLLSREDETLEKNVTVGNTRYDEKRKQDNSKYSLIGELSYTHNFPIGAWTSGYWGKYSYLQANTQNRFQTDQYSSHLTRQYAYTEFSGRAAGFLYRVSLGLTHLYRKWENSTEHTLQFTPKVVLGYSINPMNSLRLTYSWKPYSPGLKSLSSNIQSLSYNILRTGNTNLKDESLHRIELDYTLQCPFGQIMVTPRFDYTLRPIFTTYLVRDGKIWEQPVNFKDQQDVSISIAGMLLPLGNNLLQIQFFARPTYSTLHTGSKTHQQFWVENGVLARVNYQGFSLTGAYCFPMMRMSGIFLRKMENTNYAELAYRYKAWSFKTGVIFIATPSRYATKTQKGYPLYYQNNRAIYDNKNMVTIGISYHFQTGKKKDYEKNLENEDSAKPNL